MNIKKFDIGFLIWLLILIFLAVVVAQNYALEMIMILGMWCIGGVLYASKMLLEDEDGDREK